MLQGILIKISEPPKKWKRCISEKKTCRKEGVGIEVEGHRKQAVFMVIKCTMRIRWQTHSMLKSGPEFRCCFLMF